MAKYMVRVTTPEGNSGLESPFPIEAENEQEAKEALARLDGSSVEDLARKGLTVWTVSPI